MKRFVSLCAVVSLALWLSPAIHAQGNQITPGTQVRLTLVNGLSTSVAHDGDPFTAIVAEPVFLGNELILPAGAKVHGTVSAVDRPKWFSMFRGGASMNLAINSIEVESRIFPAKMSILSIYSGGTEATKQRKDLKTVEGEDVQESRGIKGDVMDVAIGTAGGSTVGLLFSHVLARHHLWIGRRHRLRRGQERQGRGPAGADGDPGAHGLNRVASGNSAA